MQRGFIVSSVLTVQLAVGGFIISGKQRGYTAGDEFRIEQALIVIGNILHWHGMCVILMVKGDNIRTFRSMPFQAYAIGDLPERFLTTAQIVYHLI